MLDELIKQVRLASHRPEIRSAIRDLYQRLQVEIDRRKPICTGSGRCCHFEEYGHRLYVTTLELAVFSDELSEIKSRQNRGSLPIASAGDCVFQEGKACGVHEIRPFGCRMFYCDPSADEWQKEQYEQFHAELKRLHEEFGIGYFYVEWRSAVAVIEIGHR